MIPWDHRSGSGHLTSKGNPDIYDPRYDWIEYISRLAASARLSARDEAIHRSVMSAGKAWAGEHEFGNSLKELNNTHPVPSSKVKAAVNVAMKYPNDFKMIVFDLEKWMKKSNLADRIAGIFVMDSICRGSRTQHRDKSKDLFSSRFLTRLNEIVSLLNGSSDHDIVSSIAPSLY
jgi:hypothetical protein